ncbi:MAG: hypothetical protein HY905_21730 [Deltaproteobacteria bacterium]|nr:hypothetical protein [Deltaproteobacteria bacterium]
MAYEDLELHHQRLTQNPTDPTAFAALRDFFLQQGQNGQAAELYEFRAGHLPDPRERAEHLFQAGLLWIDREHDRPRGQRDLEEAFRVQPTHEGVGDKLEELHRADQNFGALSQLITQRILSVEQLGEIPETARIRSRLYQNLGELKERVENDPKEAIRCYKRAYAIDPSNVLALYLSREIYRRAGDMRSASKLYELEIKSESAPERQVALLRELATLRADSLQDLDGAVEALERATQILPADVDAVYDLSAMLARRAQGPSPRPDDTRRAADCLFQLARMGDPGQGVDYLEYALDLFPDHDAALQLYGQRTAEAGTTQRFAERVRGWFAARGPAQASVSLLRAAGQVEWDIFHNAEAARPIFQTLAQRGDPVGAQRLAELGGGAVVAGAAKAPPRAVPQADALPDFVTAPKAVEAGGDVDSLFGEPAAPTPMRHATGEAPTRLVPPDLADALAGAADAAMAPAAAEPGLEEGAPAGEADVEALRDKAQKLRMMGKDQQVEAVMEQIVGAVPGDAEAVAYLERRYRAKGNFAGLRKMLLEAGMSRTLAANVRVMRLKEAAALAEGRLNDPEGAVTAWQRVLTIDPNHGDARRSLERLLRKLEKWGDLVELLEQRVQMAEDDQEKLQLLTRIAGLQEQSLKDPSATLDTVWRIHGVEEGNVKHLKKIQNLAEATQRWEDLARALSAEVELVESPAEKLRAREKLVVTQHEKLNAFTEALETVDAILVDHSDHVPTLRRQVDLLVATAQPERAADALDVLVGRLPDKEKPAALGRLAEVCRKELQDISRAADALQRALQIDAVNEAVREEMHKMYEELGRFTDIADSYEAWAKATRDPARRKQLQRRAAQVYDQQVGDLEAACQRFALILKEGDDQEALEAFARLHEMQQDWPALVDNTVRRANIAAGNEDKARLLTEAAQILDDRLGEPAKAAVHLERILKELSPDHRETLSRLVDVYVRAENHLNAAGTLERLKDVTADPEEQLKHAETLGEWYRGPLANAAMAIETYEKILQQWSGHGGALLALTELYDQEKDFEKLLKVLRARSKGADLPSDQAALLLEGAKAAEQKLGDKERAWGWFQEALTRDPDSGDLFDEVCAAGRRLERWEQLAGLYESAASRAKSDEERVQRLREAAKVWEEDAKRPNQALEDTVEAVRTNPADDTLLAEADRLAALGGAWELLGKAYDLLLRRADLVDDRVALLRRFANVVLEDGRRPEFSLGPLLRAMEEHPDDLSLFEMYEKAARASGHYEDLLRAYDKRCRAATEPAQRWPLMMHAGEIYAISMGNGPKGLQVVGIAINQDVFSDEMAEEALRTVEKIEESLPADQKGSGWAFLVGHYTRLANGYELNDPTRIIFHRRVATVHLQGAKNPEAAFEAMRTAHLLAPTDEMLVEDLEKLARENKFLDQLAAHYADALQRSTRVDVAKDLHRRRAALLEADLGRLDEAAEHYWQLLQLDPDDVDARQKVAAFYEKVGRWNDLVVILEEDLGKVLYDDEKVTLLTRIATIWEEKIGNRFEAIDVLRKVLKLRPDDDDLKARIKQLAAPRLAADESDDTEEAPEAAVPPTDADWGAAPGADAAAPETAGEPGAAEPTMPVETAGEGAGDDSTLEDGAAEAPMPPVEQEVASPPAGDEGMLPIEEEAAPAVPAATGEPSLPTWDDRDNSSKVSLEQLEFMKQQHPEAAAADGSEVPIESEAAPAEGEAAGAGFSFGSTGEPAPGALTPAETAFTFGTGGAQPEIPAPPLDTTGEIATGEIQVADLEEEAAAPPPPEVPRRPSAPPPPRRKR